MNARLDPKFLPRMNEREAIWKNGFFNPGTYSGVIRSFIFACVVTYFLWHFDEIFAWYKVLKGNTNYRIDPAKQSWAQLWALIIGIPPILASIFAMIMIPINRRRAQEYADDQRRRRVEQTWKPEGDSESPPETTAKAVWSEQDAPPVEESVGSDEPQDPVGIRPPPNTEPPERFGNVHLEKKDGRATLVVPKR